MRTTTVVGLALAAVLAILPGASRAATLPEGFSDTLVATVAQPTAMAFTPDGRLLVTTQGGRSCGSSEDGALLADPRSTCRLASVPQSERGLLGVAVDPAFATNQHIYLYYTFKKSRRLRAATRAEQRRSTASRASCSPTTTSIDPASELVLIDNMPSPAGNHNGGDLQFGKDGYLYVSVGDGGCDYAGDSGCAGANDAARDQHVLLGKILRITADGGIPADNPFQGAGTARCNVTGATDAGQPVPGDVRLGPAQPVPHRLRPERGRHALLHQRRRPERLGGDRPRPGGRRLRLERARGPLRQQLDHGLRPAAGRHDQPDLRLRRTRRLRLDHRRRLRAERAVAGGLRRRATCSATTSAARSSPAPTALRLGGPATSPPRRRSAWSTCASGPSAPRQALYYTTYPGSGPGAPIAYTAATAPPSRVAAASPTEGRPSPLAVIFDGGAQQRPRRRHTDLRLGLRRRHAQSTAVSPGHTYRPPAPTRHAARARRARSELPPTPSASTSATRPPTPTIQSPSPDIRFRVGQTITLHGTATDAAGRAAPAFALTWTVLLHHDTHTHPFLGPTPGNDIAFNAPAPEDLAAATTSYLEIRLTATDSQGADAARSARTCCQTRSA